MVSVRFRIWDLGFRICLIIVSLFLFTVPMSAQEVRATAKVDSNHIMIGDWFNLYFEVEYTTNANVTIPIFPDTLEGFEVIKRESPLVKKINQATMELHIFTLTSFDSGMHIIPPIPVYYNHADDTTKYLVKTSPIVMIVGGMAVDTTQDIKDIKPPLSVPITFTDVLPYLLVVIGVAGIVWFTRYIIRKRKRGEPLIPEEPPRPAHEVALEALRSLESEKLWQRGKIKDYHSQLTDIIRTYIERKFKILAMESTSDEILSALVDGIVVKEMKESLKEILIRADLVKFAKFQPIAEENETSLALAYKFVELTWKKEPEQEVEQSVEEVNA
ncbi:MAG: hypothetical protein QME52_02600 [Bacteroidota bacterium]|nr:hypothetical protein [Bacteroidota bacterium]